MYKNCSSRLIIFLAAFHSYILLLYLIEYTLRSLKLKGHTMRIAIIGQSAFGEAVLKALVREHENIVGVFCPPDKENRPQDPIKASAESNGIPVFQFSRMRDSQCIDIFKALSADLCIMAYVIDIVPDEILTSPKKGTIQYHPSLLPKHRGPSAINWSIINGDKTTGFTIFWPDGGLDTGPILYQKKVDIGPEDTTGSLYFNSLFPQGVNALIDAAVMVRKGTAPRIEQDHPQATYEGWCKSKDVVINWSESINVIHNLIRGSDPSPGAKTYFNGVELSLYKSSRVSCASLTEAGEVIQITEEGILISCNGGAIRIEKIKPSGKDKSTAAEWSKILRIEPGTRFKDIK